MAEIKSFGTEYDVTRKTLKSSAKFKLADSVSVRVSAAEPSPRWQTLQHAHVAGRPVPRCCA